MARLKSCTQYQCHQVRDGCLHGISAAFPSVNCIPVTCTSLMEAAAVHRMATAITQLTLCQVTSEKVETATKLLTKAYHKLKGILEVPSQQVTDLENTTQQLRQLSHTLDRCTISASYEASEAQKALLLLPRTEKGSSTSSKKHYANLPDPTYADELQEH